LSFTGFFLLFLLSVVVVKIKVFRTRGAPGGRMSDNWTFPVLFASYLISVMGALVEYFGRMPDVNLWVSVPGYVLATCGVAINGWSVRALGPWWSARIEIKRGHRVVEAGPYRFSRHPYYLATLLELGGLALILNSFYTLCYVFLVHTPLLAARILYEERVLLANLGNSYRSYRERVGIIPGMVSR
jgi:methyltransferase